MLQYLATGGLHILRNYIKDKNAHCNKLKQYRQIERAPYFLVKILN